MTKIGTGATQFGRLQCSPRDLLNRNRPAGSIFWLGMTIAYQGSSWRMIGRVNQ
jgi:hypothetical protein